MTTKNPSTEELLLEALTKVLTITDECALAKTTGSPGDAIFLGTAKKTKQAQALAVDRKCPLMATKRKGRSTVVTGLTDKGLSFLIAHDRIDSDLFDNIRGDHKRRLLHIWATTLNNKLRKAQEEILFYLPRITETFEDTIRLTDELRHDVERIHVALEHLEVDAPDANTDPLDIDNDLNHEATSLINEWLHSSTEQIRTRIEKKLRHIGASKLGEKGQIVDFSKKYHQCQGSIIPGLRVEILREGWILSNGKTERVLLKSKVEAVSN